MMKKRFSLRAALRFWQNPRLRYGSLSTLLLGAMLALLVLLNMLATTLEKENGWRIDYSFNAVTSHSQTTADVLARLEHPVHIYALFSRGQEDAPLMALLDRYAAASDLVTWELTDVSLNPGLLTRFRGNSAEETITNDSLVVYCADTDRWRILNPEDFISLSLNYEEGVYEIAGLTYESCITSAISYVTQESIPRVMVLQGHGELNAEEIAVLTDLLEANHYEVCFFTFQDAEVDLSPDDLLLLLSPVRDLMDTELSAIVDFADKGGSILFTCDYTDPVDRMPNYASLLRSYGFVPMDGVVVASAEERNTYYDGNPIFLIPYMQSSELTLELIDGQADTLLMPASRAFETPEGSDRSLTVTPILSSGYKAYLRSSEDLTVSLEQGDDDPVGPFALALQATRITDGGYVSRALVLGSSLPLISDQIHMMTDSQEFIVKSVEFLLDVPPVDLNIMARAAMRPQLSVDSAALGSVILVALPLCVLAAALLVLWPRRYL